MRRRSNEFKKLPGLPGPAYDALVCNETGYAIPHLFLQDYDDKKIMLFCEESPMGNMVEPQIFASNRKVVNNYTGSKDLMMIWETSVRTPRAVPAFANLRHLGTDKTFTARHAGRTFSFYVLTIPKANIPQFKYELNWPR